MSDNTPPDNSPPGGKRHRLINPTVWDYMEAVSLQKFYGGYQIVEMDPNIFNLGIGEVANIPSTSDLYQLYTSYMQGEALEPKATRYAGTLGERETNAAVAGHLNQWLGNDRLDEMRVVSLDGGHNAVEVAIRVFTSPLGSPDSEKNYVLVASPTYPYISSIVSAHAGLMSFLAYDGESFTRGVETYCNPRVGLIIVNVPHNPLGYALDAAQVARINHIAAAYDCAILVDCVYANFPADEGVGTALGQLDPERTVYVDSFSKKYGLPGLRIGFAASPAQELTFAMRFVKMGESLTPSTGKLAFAGHLLREYPHYPEHIGRTVRLRRDRFLERFDPAALPGVRVLGGADNPFYMALDISGICRESGRNDIEVSEYLLERFNLKVFPGSFVYPNTALPHSEFGRVGRLNPHGQTPYFPPEVPNGAQIVFAPNLAAERISMLRLSFGTETRVEGAAEALTEGLRTLCR